MLIIPPPKVRNPRGHIKWKAVSPPAGAPLVLQDAYYNNDGYLTLRFDRAIDVSGVDGSAIVVNDMTAGSLFNGTGGVSGLDDVMVIFTLVVIGSATEAGIHLNASASSGIVAVDDGGTWAGVSELELPWEP